MVLEVGRTALEKLEDTTQHSNSSCVPCNFRVTRPAPPADPSQFLHWHPHFSLSTVAVPYFSGRQHPKPLGIPRTIWMSLHYCPRSVHSAVASARGAPAGFPRPLRYCWDVIRKRDQSQLSKRASRDDSEPLRELPSIFFLLYSCQVL